MQREQLIELASRAARDPSQASRIAAWIADTLRQQASAGETATPEGYLYAGAHEWVISTQNLTVESLTTVPLTMSQNPYIPFRVPFDALLVGLQGWAEPASTPGSPALQQFVASSLASAEDGRDLFSVSFAIDGQASFVTDGTNQLMLPASVVTGTRLNPRPMAWTVRRNQLLQAKFRNVTNVPLDGVSTEVLAPIILKRVYLGFTALNLGSP